MKNVTVTIDGKEFVCVPINADQTSGKRTAFVDNQWYHIKAPKEQKSRFNQGFICAVTALIKAHGISTEAEELFRTSGLVTWNLIREAGIDPYDQQILKLYARELRIQGHYLPPNYSETDKF